MLLIPDSAANNFIPHIKHLANKKRGASHMTDPV